MSRHAGNGKYSVDSKDRVECPVCHNKYKYINNFHLKKHGYDSEKEFSLDYPGTKLRIDQVEKNMRESFRTSNKDVNHQRNSALIEWSNPEFRLMREQFVRKQLYEIFHTDKYPEVRHRIMCGRNGKKSTYTTEDGRVLYLRSFLECKVTKFLELINEEFEYELLEVPYVDPEGVSRKYIPDYYIKSRNLIIEAKPVPRQVEPINELKKNASLDAGYNYLFIGSEIETEWSTYKKLIKDLSSSTTGKFINDFID